MFHSIITTHRNRPDCLRVFLKSFEIASKHVKSNSYEIIIVDLGSSGASRVIANSFSGKLNFNYYEIPYKDVFWKTKALNFAFTQSVGDYVSMIDIDSLVTPSFLSGVEDFFAGAKNINNRLSHRVKFLNDKLTKQVKDGNFDEQFIKKNIISMSGFLNIAKERFTLDERDAISEEDYQKNALGNSHFTIKREHYEAIGGYDERFKGRTWEDLDFNSRLFKHLGCATLRKDPEYCIYHMNHMHEKNWATKDYSDINSKIYADNKENKKIAIVKNQDWGVFK
jgi:predicted glycosyltransferase involved in capsule biosynthesis